MRHTNVFVIAVLFVAACAHAQSAPQTQPAPAATQPGAVLILPFAAPADEKFGPLGGGIQQDLAGAIGPNLRGRAIASAGAAPAPDASAAIAAARDAHASAVVFGRVRVNANEVRLTGEVLDAATGKSMGELKATGPADQIFRLEDDLVPQVIAALPADLLNIRGLTSARQSAPPMRIIQLPGDAPLAPLANGPIDGGYAGPLPPAAPLVPPGGPPPYSPYAGSYPYRFAAPYAQLFTYDYDPDPFLPLFGGRRHEHERSSELRSSAGHPGSARESGGPRH